MANSGWSSGPSTLSVGDTFTIDGQYLPRRWWQKSIDWLLVAVLRRSAKYLKPATYRIDAVATSTITYSPTK